MPQEYFIVKVVTEEEYAFPVDANGWTPEQLVEEFFSRTDPNLDHAGRDNARIGGSKKIISTSIQAKRFSM